MSIPVLDWALRHEPERRSTLLSSLQSATFEHGFMYIQNHGIDHSIIQDLTTLLPKLFDLPLEKKLRLSKENSPHFLGYNGYAEEVTLGRRDLREQFDFATELPVIWNAQDPVQDHKRSDTKEDSRRNFSDIYWRLRGPNQWPLDEDLTGFRKALTTYHDAVASLARDFVHILEEALGIEVGAFDQFFEEKGTGLTQPEHLPQTVANSNQRLPPQHRIKLLKYPATSLNEAHDQGVGAHKDSSGWLTFLYQVGTEQGLEVLSVEGTWIKAPPIEGTFVVNFGNAVEAATSGDIPATVHRVKAPRHAARYSIPFFMGLPLDLTVSEIRSVMPASVRAYRKQKTNRPRVDLVEAFLDPRWDSLGESQLRKWIRSHPTIGLKWYGPDVVEYYTS